MPPGRTGQRNGWSGAGPWRPNSFPSAQNEAPFKVQVSAPIPTEENAHRLFLSPPFVEPAAFFRFLCLGCFLFLFCIFFRVCLGLFPDSVALNRYFLASQAIKSAAAFVAYLLALALNNNNNNNTSYIHTVPAVRSVYHTSHSGNQSISQ